MTSAAPPLRVVLAKVGLDGHDRGVKVVARALRDAGMHVIYAGLWQTPEAVVRTVADEDADWVGLSLLSGAHMVLVPRVLGLLRDMVLAASCRALRDHSPSGNRSPAAQSVSIDAKVRARTCDARSPTCRIPRP